MIFWIVAVILFSVDKVFLSFTNFYKWFLPAVMLISIFSIFIPAFLLGFYNNPLADFVAFMLIGLGIAGSYSFFTFTIKEKTLKLMGWVNKEEKSDQI